MRTFTARSFSALLAFAALPLLAQPDAKELLKNPKYAEKDLKPVLKRMTAEEVRDAIRVTSGRNSAWMGFNDASVQVHLPRVDNSIWLEEKFSEPKLLDKKKKEVKFQKEQGIYSHDSWSTEIRFAGTNGKPVEFAQAVGSVHIRYPLSMKTVSVKKNKASDSGVTFDGPFIKTDSSIIPEGAFGAPIDGVRAYDKNGKRLEKVMGYFSSGISDGVSYKGYAFHGDVARVDVDVVEQWGEFDIDYELPPAAKLAESLSGTPSKVAATIAATPGAKVNVRITPSEAP